MGGPARFGGEARRVRPGAVARARAAADSGRQAHEPPSAARRTSRDRGER